MAMKLVKKTDEYSIFQRGDKRYAVQDANKKAVNGDEKVAILVEEGLITAAVAAAPEEVVEEVAEEVAEDAAEEVVAEEAVDEAPAEEAAAEDEDK
jgi:ethanolamine ammonia-lyase small subunit